MAKSVQVMTRFTEEEVGMLDRCCNAPLRGTLNRSEMIRYLVHREYERLTTKSKRRGGPVPQRYISTDFRRGRPKKDKD